MLKIAAIILAVIGFLIFREWTYVSFAMWAVAVGLFFNENLSAVLYIAGILLVAAVLWYFIYPYIA